MVAPVSSELEIRKSDVGCKDMTTAAHCLTTERARLLAFRLRAMIAAGVKRARFASEVHKHGK